MRRSSVYAAVFFVISAGMLLPRAGAQLSVEAPSPFSFVAYGDIRFTDPANKQVSNPQARRALVRRIAEAHPAFVLVTGDLVLEGGQPADWKVWDSETEPLRAAGTPIFPVIGNHELHGDPKVANYLAHFPALANRRWYTVRAGNVLCLMLDSTSNAVGGEEWQWLEQQLAHVPDDVDFLVFVMHYPAYTRSNERVRGGGHSARPAEAKLAAMLAQRQAAIRQRMLVISGHVHNYERYEHGGVMYVVSGGGGATPYAIERAPQDFYRESGPTYHFLQLVVDGRKLKVTMNKLDTVEGKATWAEKDSFQLRARPLAKAARAH